MDVLLVAADPDRADALERAAARCGHRVMRLPRAFNAAVDALNGADVVLADFAAEPATAAWCLAFALARGRLALASSPAHMPLPSLVRDNPSQHQRVAVGDAKMIEREAESLLRL
ncbi:MAG TPA: hypothetical protein VI997_05530 [Candidatus Thermoplasmatota archaeon]|nr:hypothetical protein [Candidatus Thermoplasmatota archaeon]